MISSWYTDSATVEVVSIDEWNQETVTSTTIRCRVDYKSDIIRGSDGIERQANHLVFCDPATVVEVGNRMIFNTIRGVATGDNNRYPVLSVSWEGGLAMNHKEIRL